MSHHQLSNTLDAGIPEELQKTLFWFGSIIERPIDLESRMMPIAPSGRPMEEEARDYITPSPTLEPHQRIELYNQQYWWRLLGILHENFPCLTRLFGYQNFNESIGVAYLCRYRPDDWSLARLGKHLPQFLTDTYHGADRELVINSATLDFAYVDAFLSVQQPSLSLTKAKTNADLAQVLNQTLFLQSHVRLFDFGYHLFNFREEIIKETDGDHFLENPFPTLDSSKRFYFVLYRNAHNRLSWKEISTGEQLLLQIFQRGSSVAAACDWLAQQDGPLVEQALTNIHFWLQEWTLCGLLTPRQDGD